MIRKKIEFWLQTHPEHATIIAGVVSIIIIGIVLLIQNS